MDTQERATLTEHLRSLQAGDPASARPAFDILWPRLTALARRYGLNQSDSEDAAQRALIKVMCKLGDYNPSRDGMSWVTAVTVYEVRTLRRQRWRRRETPIEGHVDRAADPSPDSDPLVQRESWQNVQGALSTLSDADREALRAGLERSTARGPLGNALRKRKQRALGRLILEYRSLCSEL